MSKIRTLVVAAAVVLVAAPALASEQSTDTTDQSSLQSTSEALLRVLGNLTPTGVGVRVGSFLGALLTENQGGNPDQARALAAAGGAAGLSAGDEQTGMSAGATPGRLGVWVSGGYTGFEDELSSTAYDAEAYNVLTGADYQFNDRFLAGLALGYESSDIDTHFNTGNISSDGWTISPYAGYVLNRYFTVDVSAGFSTVDYEMLRIHPVTGTTITGGTDASRWFMSGNLNGYYAFNRVLLSGKVGYLYSIEDQDGYTETDGTANPQRDLHLGQIRVGGQVGYDLGKVQPYITTTYVYDTTREKVRAAAGQAQPANDRSGVDVGGGVRFALSDRVTGGVQGTTHLGRSNFDSVSVNGNLRIKF